jgi:hypothetical protein
MNNTESMLFIGDNGMCLCAKHCGNSIRNTGRDISGQPAQQITKEQAKKHGLSCEVCA